MRDQALRWPLPLRTPAGTVGFIDGRGKWVIEPRFDFGARFSEARALVRVAGRYGFIDERGELRVPAEYTGANWFSNGYACTSQAGLHRFVDPLGALLDSPPLEVPASYREKLAVIRSKGVNRVLRHDGALAFERSFDFARPYADGVSAVCAGGQWQYVDAQGLTVLRVEGIAESFGSGLAPVKGPKGWAFIDLSGAMVVPGPFASAMPFSNGRALVQRGGRFGFIDAGGREVVPCQYISAQRFSGERAWVRTSAKGPAQAIDPNGNVCVTAPEGYDLLAPFLEGVALIATSNLATRDSDERYLTADGATLSPQRA